MRAENELQWMMDFFPEIFPTRKHCLDHLFCVIGNGYEWENGELVDNDSEYKHRYKMLVDVDRATSRNEEFWNQMSKTEQELSVEIEGYVPRNRYVFKWYPLCKEFSYLYNYPENIKPDWKALLEECKQLLITDGIEV